MLKLCAFLSGCWVLLVASLCQADSLLFEDTFDTENGGVAALNYTGFAHWDVTAGQVDLGGTAPYDPYPGNGMYVDLDGSPGQGRMETKTVFNLVPGLYRLSFDLGNYGGDSNTARVTLSDVFSEDFSANTVTPLLSYTRDIAVGSATSGKIVFEMLTPSDNFGFILDDVKLEFVPEPGTALLFCLGLMTLSASRLRRRT